MLKKYRKTRAEDNPDEKDRKAETWVSGQTDDRESQDGLEAVPLRLPGKSIALLCLLHSSQLLIHLLHPSQLHILSLLQAATQLDVG